jgi:hypothetical protein
MTRARKTDLMTGLLTQRRPQSSRKPHRKATLRAAESLKPTRTNHKKT